MRVNVNINHRGKIKIKTRRARLLAKDTAKTITGRGLPRDVIKGAPALQGRDLCKFRFDESRHASALLINGHPVDRLPHVLSVSFDSRKLAMEGEMLVMNMDLNGIAVSSGSACTSGSIQPSHVLLAMGRDEATAKATLRFSFGKGNTGDDIPVVVEALQASVAQMTSGGAGEDQISKIKDQK